MYFIPFLLFFMFQELLNSLQTVDDCVSRLEGWLSSIPENPTVSGPYILDNSRNTVQLKRKLNGTHSLGEKEMFVDANLDEESVTCWPNDFFADCSYVCVCLCFM